MNQWKCKLCGEWVSGIYLKHHHTIKRPATLEEMRLAREANAVLLETVDVTEDTWTPQHEMRDGPPTNTD